MARLLLTRPRAEARALARCVRARGWMPILCPMLDLVFLARAWPHLPPQAALAFTSANGVRALRACARPRQWDAARMHRVFAVGEATAAEARAAGFAHVVQGDGDWHALAALLVRAQPPCVAHISGRDGAGALVRRLKQAGISARTHIVYAAAMRRRLPVAVVRRLLRGQIEGALFFSARTASAFRAAVRAHPQAGALTRALATVPAFCLAPAVAARVRAPMPTRIAAAPSSQALLDEVHKWLALARARQAW